MCIIVFFFQAEDGIRDYKVTGVQTCALPICGILSDPPLPDEAVRPVLRGDATAELPQIMSTAKEVLGNIAQLTAPDSALGGSLTELRGLAGRAQGPGGVLGVVMGSEQEARSEEHTSD